MHKSDITNAQLRKLKALHALRDDELSEFLSYVEPVTHAKGTVLFEEGQAGDCMFFILTGLVRVFHRKQSGQIDTLQILAAGDAFGDIALFHETTRKASVESLEETFLLKLSAASLQEYQRKDPKRAIRFLQELTHSLSQMYSH